MGNTVEKTNRKAKRCEICMEPFSLRRRKFKTKTSCRHDFCKACMIRYLKANVQENVGEIPCPGLRCKKILDPVSLRPFIGRTIFNKWCDLLCDSTLLRVEKCYCPYEDCSVLVLNECGDDVKRTKCPSCKRWFCFNCMEKWHEGYRCEETSKDREFGVYAERKKWRRCPGCRSFVERISGCYIMRCRCNTKFCYRCGKSVNRHFCLCKEKSVRPRNMLLGFIGCLIKLVPVALIFTLSFVYFSG